MNNNRTEFSKKAIELIRSVPKGKVATYGLIARLAGNPQSSRRVGWLLHSSTQKYALPWQRIIKSDGKLSFPPDSVNFIMQKQLLEAEGIIVKNGRVNLKQFLWKNDLDEPSWFI
ncbi:MAG: MGMT family protein [Proteobacteria bacterium]|nr:MGMT family protein [Pseudomonadota bacterium]